MVLVGGWFGLEIFFAIKAIENSLNYEFLVVAMGCFAWATLLMANELLYKIRVDTKNLGLDQLKAAKDQLALAQKEDEIKALTEQIQSLEEIIDKLDAALQKK